jgi:ankyrin repeat protein
MENILVYTNDLFNLYDQQGFNENNIREFDELFENGANINASNNGKTLLMLAFEKNDFVFINKLLLISCKSNKNINLRDKYGFTPLIYASMSGNIDIVNKLIEKGANINERDNNNVNSLIWASFFGNVDIVNKLIEHNAEITSEELNRINFPNNEKGQKCKYLIEQELSRRNFETFSQMQNEFKPLNQTTQKVFDR